MKSTFVAIAVVVALLVVGCSQPPIYISGERGRHQETSIVFVNLDPVYEYLVFVPGTSMFGTGCWVYVPANRHDFMSLDEISGVLGEAGISSPVAQPYTSAFPCRTGIVTFSYLTLRSGRLLSGGVSSFSLFIVPAGEGRSRIINLVGYRL
jgi:hypothetical protein